MVPRHSWPRLSLSGCGVYRRGWLGVRFRLTEGAMRVLRSSGPLTRSPRFGSDLPQPLIESSNQRKQITSSLIIPERRVPGDIEQSLGAQGLRGQSFNAAILRDDRIGRDVSPVEEHGSRKQRLHFANLVACEIDSRCKRRLGVAAAAVELRIEVAPQLRPTPGVSDCDVDGAFSEGRTSIHSRQGEVKPTIWFGAPRFLRRRVRSHRF